MAKASFVTLPRELRQTILFIAANDARAEDDEFKTAAVRFLMWMPYEIFLQVAVAQFGLEGFMQVTRQGPCGCHLSYHVSDALHELRQTDYSKGSEHE